MMPAAMTLDRMPWRPTSLASDREKPVHPSAANSGLAVGAALHGECATCTNERSLGCTVDGLSFIPAQANHAPNRNDGPCSVYARAALPSYTLIGARADQLSLALHRVPCRRGSIARTAALLACTTPSRLVLSTAATSASVVRTSNWLCVMPSDRARPIAYAG